REFERDSGCRKEPCSEGAADKSGCFFAGLSTTLTLKASAEVGGEVSVTFGGSDCDDCTKVSLEGRLAADATLPFTISNVGYNEESCSEASRAASSSSRTSSSRCLPRSKAYCTSSASM